VAQQPQSVTDGGVHEISQGLLVVPGDAGLAGIGAVVRGALDGRDLVRAGDLADHRTHCGYQLGDGVLGRGTADTTT
jgi:hypothetical protein